MRNTVIAVVLFFAGMVAVHMVRAFLTPKKEEVKVINYSAESENQKRFMAIKVIDFDDDTKAIDAYGNELQKGHWYLQCNANRVLFLVIPGRSNQNLTMFGENEIESLNFPLSPDKEKKVKMKVIVNNGTPMGVNIDAEILLLGEKELETKSFYNFQELTFKR